MTTLGADPSARGELQGAQMSMTPGSPTAAAAPLSFLGFDYGTRRVGVASGNTLTGQATPLCTLAVEGERRFTEVGRLIAAWQPNALIVGVPLHPDGAPHENTQRARRFARQLHGRFRLPVHEVDERYSTTEAESLGARDLDAASAAILLEQFFAEQGRNREPGPGPAPVPAVRVASVPTDDVSIPE